MVKGYEQYSNGNGRRNGEIYWPHVPVLSPVVVEQGEELTIETKETALEEGTDVSSLGASAESYVAVASLKRRRRSHGPTQSA